MAVGDVFVYPTFDGECINPYYGLKEQGRYARKGAIGRHDSLETKWLVGLGRRRLRAGIRFSFLVQAADHFYSGGGKANA